MARTKISEFSSTAADNTDIDGIDIAEGCAPSGINNAIRTLMADLKDMQTGASGDTFTFASLNATTANIDGGTIDGATIGGSSAAAGTFTSLSDSGNLTFTGTGNRITGDFSNATVANRVMFQTSTSGGNTSLGLIAHPSNATPITTFEACLSSDPANSNVMQAQVTTTDVRFNSGARGTASFLPMTFYTGGSERLRIDTSGNVGIGTTSPNSRLTVQQATSDATVGASLRGYTTATADGQRTFITQYVDSSNSYFANHRSQATTHQFYVNSAEVARIDSSGNLLVGTTSNAFGAKTVSVVGSSPAFAARFSGAGGAGTGFNSIYDNTTGTAYGAVFYYNGTANQPGAITYTSTTTTYSTSSDYRLKENVQPMQNALATVAQLKPCTYTWKADGSDGQGFIAHELQAVVPDAVTGEKDAVDADGKPIYQGVDTSFLVATLTAAIQEQQAIINSLQDRITLLEQAK